jgi:hypothetical protein
MKLLGFPTYRCGECTLMRCYESGQTCDECRQHVREVFDTVARPIQGNHVSIGSATYAPYDWFNHAP